jgi:hypothetical protein
VTTIIENRRSRWWLWLLLAVLALVIAAAVVGNRTDIAGLPAASTASSPLPAIPTDDPREDDDWVLGDVQINPSWGALTARILNQTAATRSTYFTVTVLSDGHLVGAFSGALNDIEPGATATATLIGTYRPASENYTYELQAG